MLFLIAIHGGLLIYDGTTRPFRMLFYYFGIERAKNIKWLDLDGAKLSNSERREVESLGRHFTKLKARDKGLVRLLVTKLAQTTS